MKKLTPKKLVCIALLLLVGIFVANTYRFRAFGRVVDSATLELDSVSHRVLLRERCSSSLDTYLILDRVLRSRLPEYEYWTELPRSGRIVAASKRVHWDSTSNDHPSIDTADASGVTVTLDPRPPHPSIHRFDWLPSTTKSPSE